MGRGTAADFSEAARRHGELNDRQHMVLELVAKGRTNWQIAEQLGVTLDGAKWHVGELLSIFGFSTREELADYYRWHNRLAARMGRAVRGLAALPFTRPLVGAGVIAGTAAVVGAVLIAGHESGKPDSGGGIPPFELTAHVVVNDRLQAGMVDTSTSDIKWSFRSSSDWKWTVDTVSGLDSDTTVATVHDGSMLVYYGADNAYGRTPFTSAPNVAVPPSMGAFIGPLPFKDLDAFTKSFAANSGPAVTVIGHERLLGRMTTVLQLSPVNSSSSNGADVRSGVTRIWLDEERMFAMKGDSTDDTLGSGYEIDVTKLRYGVARDSIDTAFDLPAGALERSSANGNSGTIHSAGSASSAVGGAPAGITVPAGFLKPSYIPVDHMVVSSGTRTNALGTLDGVDIGLSTGTAPGLPYATIEERKRHDGLPAGLVTSDKTRVNGHDAYRGTSGAARTLAWTQDDVAILITSDTLPYDELERIAASMHP